MRALFRFTSRRGQTTAPSRFLPEASPEARTEASAVREGQARVDAHVTCRSPCTSQAIVCLP